MMIRCWTALLLAAGVCSALGSRAAEAPAWPDTPLARLEALALIQTLNAEILSSNSATLTLEHWCREHALADPAVILAHRTEQGSEAASEGVSAAVRADLEVSARQSVHYRRVELTCGEQVLSVAENWYVPARLTAQMNRLLERTQTPFGKVVQPLRPHRETKAADLLWTPLPDGWERGAHAPAAADASPQPLDFPMALFEHRAILYTPAHQPLAEVHEVYQRGILAFPQPQLPH
ncbi:MAG: hypothetical protein ACHP9W_07545 [Steroidobacterales bacterium]